MLVRGTNGLEIEVEDQVATAMITAGIVEAVTEPALDETTETVEEPESAEEPETAPAKTKK